MTNEKLRGVIAGYTHPTDGILGATGPDQYDQRQYAQRRASTANRLAHLRWMCNEILAGRVTGDKAHRWLGFIQGVLHATNFYSVNELRGHSRSE